MRLESFRFQEIFIVTLSPCFYFLILFSPLARPVSFYGGTVTDEAIPEQYQRTGRKQKILTIKYLVRGKLN
jgi:hypothetical protein